MDDQKVCGCGVTCEIHTGEGGSCSCENDCDCPKCHPDEVESDAE